MSYWQDRQIKAQEEFEKRSIASVEKQLIKYYTNTRESVIGRFLSTYNRVLKKVGQGKEPTPADLYKLDTYWKMEAQLRDELQKFGEKQVKLLNKNFTSIWREAYEKYAITDGTNFNHIDDKAIQQIINQIWCADGKSWSKRIWDNTDKLQQALNDGLTECLLSGASPRYLRDMLRYEFNVSWNNADMLVRTEIVHIQTQATKQRYEDAGIKEVYIWADEDERRCDVCGKLHEKRYSINAEMPIPAHPRCRCRILPVIE